MVLRPGVLSHVVFVFLVDLFDGADELVDIEEGSPPK